MHDCIESVVFNNPSSQYHAYDLLLASAQPSDSVDCPSMVLGRNKKVVIEYSSPNIVKRFHLGHLLWQTCTGQRCGWGVSTSMNYLGDWKTPSTSILLWLYIIIASSAWSPSATSRKRLQKTSQTPVRCLHQNHQGP